MLCGFSDQFSGRNGNLLLKTPEIQGQSEKNHENCCSNNQCYQPKPSSLPQLGKQLLLLGLVYSHYRPEESQLSACSQAHRLLCTMEPRQYISERTSGLWPERDTSGAGGARQPGGSSFLETMPALPGKVRDPSSNSPQNDTPEMVY